MNIQSDIKVQYYDSSLTLKTRCTIPITEDALVHYELMQSHYCKCSFRSATPIAFGIGDFIDTSFGRFELIEDVKPKDDGNVGFGYELQFEAYYYKFKNKQLKYLPSSTSPELAFNLTSNIETHAQIIIDNLKALAEKGKTNLYDVRYTGEGTDYVFAIDSTVDKKKAKLISYSNLNIIDAIALIAQTFECEWWFEGNIIHFGTCENENAVTDFVEDDNIVSLSGSQSQSAYANRVYGFGSTKNIPTNYYKDAAVDVTKHGVVERRLMLPTAEECSVENKKLLEDNGFELKDGYIQVKGLSEDQYKEGIATDEDIYPKNLIKTDKITSYEKEVEDDSTTEEGDYIKRTFYRVESLTIVDEDGEKTGDMAFREAYKLSGQNLHIVFQSGSLSGLDFECEFNPDGVSEVIVDENGKPILVNGKEQINPKSQVFEIILNEDYGRPLPDNILKPKAGDTFVLYNWDASKLGKTLVVAASNELLKSVVKSVKKSMIDPTTFTCTADSNYSFNKGNGCFHTLGDRIRLLVKSLGNKVRESRIIGFEMHLDIPFDSVKYIVGEKPSYSRFASLDSKIEELEMNGNTYQGKGGSGSTIYIIKSYDRVLPTDYNVYSAKAVNEQRLNKLNDDTAQGLITFLKGLKAQDVIKAINGISLGNGENYVNGNGDANLSDVIVDRIHDKNSTPSDRTIIGAQGFDLYMGDDGKSHLFVDYLTARTRMFASSVEIRKVSYSGGTTIFSNAGSQIAKVSYIYDAAKEKVIAYKCYAVADDGTTKTMNWWHVGMMALCQTFNVKAGESKNLDNRYYWRLVVGVGQEKIEGKLYDYVILSNIKEFQGNLLTIPTYSDKTLANEQKKKLVWGNVMVEVTMDEGMQTLASLFAEQEGTDVDDNGTKIADRIFYGYDGEKPDAPAPYDVIVQVGDQIQWKKYGNVIKLSTSTEDVAEDDNDNAPAITMYHKLGAPHYTGKSDTDGNKIVNPFQWKIITTIISPEKVMHNTDNFQLFQGTPDNIVDPITIMYDIVPSVTYYTRHPSTQTTTPTDITFSLRKRTGNKVETLTDAQIYAEYTLLNGSSATKILPNKALSDIGNLYQITSVNLKSTIKEADHEDVVVTYDLPVLTDGDNGDPGSDGLDALEVTIKNAPVVFDTDSNGVVSSSAIQNAEIWVTRDGKNVIADIKNPSISVTDSLNFTVEGNNAVIRKTSKCLQIALKGIGIAKEIVNGNAVSKTSGYVVVSFNDGTNMFQRQILFNINVSKFNSSVIQTAKLYEQQYTEVSNKYDALPEEVRNKKNFTEYNSAIKQTAREISLSVTEEAAKKRNLLVNSDFVRNGGFYIFQTLFATIERYDSLNDENVWYSYPTNQVFYSKLMWEGSKVGDIDRGSHNIPIVIGKKYTISCWAKVSDTSVPLTLQVYSQAAQTGNIATASKGDLLNQEVTLDAANVWQLISYTFEAKGDYPYCSVRLFFQPLSNTRIKGYISQPMLEQADTYNGWTLAEEDYVYRNGNMLDNTRYLDVGGNLTQVGTIINNAKDNCSMSEANVDLATTARRTGTLLRYKIPLEAHTDYVLSFYVRSKDLESKQNVICTINLESGVFFAEGYMQTENESVGYISNYISLHGNSPASGYMQFSSISKEWTKVCYHFSLNSKNTALPISILAYAQNGAGTLQICQPKLEKAVTNTAWTEAKQDVAFKDKYKRAGIDLDAETIHLSAERTIIDGDLHLKGILIENSAEISYNPQQPIICDMVHHKSVSFRTWKKENNQPTWMNGIDINPYVVLPMIYDVFLSATDAHGELIVHGIKESGMKLTISSQYNPLVAKWATGKKYQYNDRYSMENQEGKPYEFLHRAAVVIFADPRLASVNNYNDSNTGRIHPQGGGVPPFFGDAKYDGGCFICNGRRSRMLFLMPGQSLHLTSSIERIGDSDVVVWYIDNSNDFTPISKTVTISAQYINGSDGYDWGGENEDKSFPDDRLNGSVGYRYEDVLLAPPQLSATYPERLPSEALGTNSVSQVPFVFNVY